jgi:hypothetical protein
VEEDATSNSRAEMEFWAAAACAYNELESSAADLSLLEIVVSLRNSSLIIKEDTGEFERGEPHHPLNVQAHKAQESAVDQTQPS